MSNQPESDVSRARTAGEPHLPATADAKKSAAAYRNAELKKLLAREEGGRKWVVRVAVLLVIAGGVYGYRRWREAHPPPKPPKYMLDEVTRGDVVETIQSTGTVQPVTQVQIGAQVTGRISKRLVDFNSVVKAGDLLAEIDSTLYEAAVAGDSARLRTAQANVARDKANLALSRFEYDRVQKLAVEGLANIADVQKSRATLDVSSAALSASEAAVVLSGSALTTSKTNLAFCKLFAPIDGVVISRTVDVGQTVVASFQTPVLFTIAQNLKSMYVFADVDEADLGRLSRSADTKVTVRVEAFPLDTFAGKLAEIRYNATVTQGIVTYPAVIEVNNPELKLRPGMTATVTIETASSKNTLRVANAALRFHPSPPPAASGEPKSPKIVRPEAPLAKGKGRVFLPPVGDGEAKALLVDVGLTDGQFTAITSDALTVGSKLVVDETDDGSPKLKPRGLF